MKNKGIVINYLPQNGDIEILGHTFHGLRELDLSWDGDVHVALRNLLSI